MASAAAGITIFSFHRLLLNNRSSAGPPPNSPISNYNYKKQQQPSPLIRRRLSLLCVDISKEDNGSQPAPELELELDPQDKLERRRLEERFAVLNTGVYECRSCGYRYDEAVGDPSYPIPPGLAFQKLPEDWRCPTCGAATSFFESKSVEIAGFAQNLQFGLGGNALTASQKALLIYGSLLLAFILFLSGYFLQ